MKELFADRMFKVPRSFVREILKVTEKPEVISFAGGLPNPDSFPYKEIAEAASEVISRDSREAMQYSTTEGYGPLREYIAQKYRKKGLKVDPAEVMITTGSQQGIDLVGKIFLNKGDTVMVERPTYLAALQSFGLYEPQFKSVPLNENGPDIDAFQSILSSKKVKLFYAIPNFQNPTGISYSKEKRQIVGEILNTHETILIEDNPYGEIRFMGEELPDIKNYTDNSILLGSFSKIVAPGMRLGWIVAGKEIMEKLVTAKQASDLHTNSLTQRVVYQYLTSYDVEEHLKKIRTMYKRQRDCMIFMMQEYFPPEVKYTEPEGGMFIWVNLPRGMSSMDLFERAIKEKVAFVPGKAFYSDNPENNTLRLNFSNSEEEKIREGIKRLGASIKNLMND
jgi:2-aminoadipate transaminase